jgi:hypothetical protein
VPQILRVGGHRTLLVSRVTGKVPRTQVNFGDYRVYRDLKQSLSSRATKRVNCPGTGDRLTTVPKPLWN